jgi:enoyl-[acyl-carrier protein] reductase II
MVLTPLVCSRIDVPVIAAGGVCDGRSMAAAFALGAEGVQLGTRMVSSAESPVHENWKQAIIAAAETDTIFLNRHSKPGLRALRTELTERLEREDHVGMELFGNARDLYFGGDMLASIPLSGQVAGRIEEIKPVAQVVDELVTGFHATIAALAERYAAATAPAN